MYEAKRRKTCEEIEMFCETLLHANKTDSLQLHIYNVFRQNNYAKVTKVFQCVENYKMHSKASFLFIFPHQHC